MSIGVPMRHGPARGGAIRDSHRTEPITRLVAVAVIAFTVLGAALRFYGLGHQGFWFDEANTSMLVRLSPGKMLGLIPQSESTPPLYYCVAWVWSRIFGNDEAGLRSLSALAGVLTIPVAFATGRELISRRAGVIVAALTACSPLLIWYSQEARSYALLVLLSGVSLWAFARARRLPSRGRLAVWTVAAVLALATHYFAAAAVVPQALWLVLEHRSRRPVLMAVAIVAVCGLALVPLAISQNGTGNDHWIATAPLGARLRQIIPQFLIGTNAPARKLLKYAAMALALAGLALLALRTPGPQRRAALGAGTLALAGLALGLVLIPAGFDDLITRNLITLWLPAALMLSGGLAARRVRGAGLAVTAALCAIGIVATVGIAVDHNLQRPDWRPVAQTLGAVPSAPGEGGRAILIQHYTDLLPLSLYLPHLSRFGRPEDVSQLDVISMVAPQQPLCWWGAACNLIPSQMQRRYAVRGFRQNWRRHIRQFTVLQMTAAHPVMLTRPAVAAALHSTRLRHDVLIYQPG